MGYFSNGTQGMEYEDKWCRRCANGSDGGAGVCTVWLAHMLNNYDDCDKEDSILNILIPRTANGLDNEKCTMFRQRPPQRPQRKKAERQLLILEKK